MAATLLGRYTRRQIAEIQKDHQNGKDWTKLTLNVTWFWLL